MLDVFFQRPLTLKFLELKSLIIRWKISAKRLTSPNFTQTIASELHRYQCLTKLEWKHVIFWPLLVISQRVAFEAIQKQVSKRKKCRWQFLRRQFLFLEQRETFRFMIPFGNDAQTESSSSSTNSAPFTCDGNIYFSNCIFNFKNWLIDLYLGFFTNNFVFISLFFLTS